MTPNCVNPDQSICHTSAINKASVKSAIVFEYLSRKGVMTNTQVANGLGLTRTTARRMLESLVRVGYVNVVSSDVSRGSTRYYSVNSDKSDSFLSIARDNIVFVKPKKRENVTGSLSEMQRIISFYARKIAELELLVEKLKAGKTESVEGDYM